MLLFVLLVLVSVDAARRRAPVEDNGSPNGWNPDVSSQQSGPQFPFIADANEQRAAVANYRRLESASRRSAGRRRRAPVVEDNGSPNGWNPETSSQQSSGPQFPFITDANEQRAAVASYRRLARRSAGRRRRAPVVEDNGSPNGWNPETSSQQSGPDFPFITDENEKRAAIANYIAMQQRPRNP